MTIWIVRRHPRHPYVWDAGFLDAFIIYSAHATKKAATEVADKKNSGKSTSYLYTVGRVSLRAES